MVCLLSVANLSVSSGKVVCDIYGTEHLLRLFTKIGELLAFTELDTNAISVLQKYIRQLLNFIGTVRGGGATL